MDILGHGRITHIPTCTQKIYIIICTKYNIHIVRRYLFSSGK